MEEMRSIHVRGYRGAQWRDTWDLIRRRLRRRHRPHSLNSPAHRLRRRDTLLLLFFTKRNENLCIHILHDVINNLLTELRFLDECLSELIRSIDTHQEQRNFSFENATLVDTETVFSH